jgi:hypothetical protein
MDRALILSYLQAAEEHIANGVQDIADQRDLISTLERTGHNATSAIARLREMEKTQTRHVADRERLRAELAVLNAAEAAKADASIVTETRDPQLGHRRRFRRTPFGRR